MNILFAEDDEHLGKMVYHLLKKEYGRVDWVKDGQSAYDYAMFTDYDVIILDWMMPELSGLEVCKRLRENGYNGGILFLTAKDSVEDVVEGLDSGADDYLIKPFKFEELVARIRALSRRVDKPFEETLTFDDLELNLNTHEVKRNGKVIELSKKEYELLELLLRNKHQVLPREMIIERIWGFDAEITDNALDALVKLLRKKVDVPGKPSIIKNVRGVGYKLRDQNGI
ncbi:response regulator transcription factor [Ureibacillus sp. FSL K6-8385]|uniref:Response regulator transcription factor n=1 Tax=Ureibacillus terrenus TaxID=118246 RepID=A0A540V3D2_9BACL|nr:response regulator transcription factor [Ureibacillus terrenus]MED3662857.1 response regulator transcription factor [Ureibacillus terrenus]MED3763841.1 response regulator transcription factor [Ureibacillus terrenus]TQE91265.1 response regulator transcription factor [Ureibacillus terrenus]